ncbi:MAG: site-specific integrase, partial [Streptococcus agalactiae]
MERFIIVKINEVKKKDGTVIYRASVYLGTDKVTGKKVTTKITGRTKKEVREKAKQGAVEFIKNGSTRFKATSVTSYQELATLWWDSYKHTVKYNTQPATEKLLTVHVIPIFGAYKLDKLTTPLIQSI